MPYEVPRNKPATAFKGGSQIRSSIHYRYTEEGGTLDAAKIGARYVAVGEPFVRNQKTGRYEPWVDGTHYDAAAANKLKAGFEDPVICDVDFDCNGTDNVIVGQLLIEASVYDQKLPTKVTASFRAATHPLIRYTHRGVRP